MDTKEIISNQDLNMRPENIKYLSIIKKNDIELTELRRKNNVYKFLIRSLELEIDKIKRKHKSEIRDLKLKLKSYNFKSDISDSKDNSESVNYSK